MQSDAGHHISSTRCQRVCYRNVIPICDQCPWSSEPGEYMTKEKACYHFCIISSGRYSLPHLETQSTTKRMYRLLRNEGKGPIKSIPQISNSSTSKIGCKGDSSRFDMLPILWHLSQVDTKWCASLNKVGQ